MQPVFPYRPESYPPKGRIWPQFGDDVLEETLSMSEGARQSLNKKKEQMGDWHKENLQHHGLSPKPEDVPTPAGGPPPPPDAPQYREEHAWPDELYSSVRRPEDTPTPDDGAYLQPPHDPGDPPEPPARQYGLPRIRPHPGQLQPAAPSPPNLPPGPPNTGRRPIAFHYMGDGEAQRPDVQAGLGRPPDFPGSGGAAFRNREYFRTTQPGLGE
jgi:hypothetical protein